ncbi:MAG: nucleotidyltransferase domain-containing protein [Candidatus Aenigmarchaeota archaeon]|nr:nucleotidyltransferase domain-containing protein [Candidatus Aenigmarchaeota archaeon]
MIFHDFAFRLLGSKTKLRIALHMLSGAGPSGERELAKSVGLSHVAVGKALKDIETVNFLRKTKIGNVHVWSLNEKSYAFSACSLEYLAKTPPLIDLKQRLEADFGEAYTYIKKVVLFGSIADGKEKESSDIDLFLLVGRHEHKQHAMKRVLEVAEFYKERYGNSIHPHIMTEADAKRNRQLSENIKRGIVIR